MLTFSDRALQVKPSATLAVTAKANELKAQGVDVASFSAGEPDFPTPQNICDAAKRAIDEGKTKYTPSAGTKELRAAISLKFKQFNHLDYTPEQIVVSTGGKQTLTNVFQTLINPGDEVIIPVPYWLTYSELVRLNGGVPVLVYCDVDNDYKITSQELLSAVTDKTKAMVLNSPCNPSGAIYSRAELEAIADVAVSHDFYVIADEMYEMLNYTDEPCVSIASLGEEIYARTITCSGVSKSYAMTGWRIGYCGSPARIASLMASIQSQETSCPSTISQAAALEALTGPQDTVRTMAEVFEKRRDLIYGRVSRFPYVSCLKPHGAFYLLISCEDITGKSYGGRAIQSSEDIADILITDYHTAVIPCTAFGLPNHIRLSFAASEEEINKGLDRIERFLANL